MHFRMASRPLHGDRAKARNQQRLTECLSHMMCFPTWSSQYTGIALSLYATMLYSYFESKIPLSEQGLLGRASQPGRQCPSQDVE